MDKKNVPIEKILLYTIAGVGLIAAVAIAPGIGPALKVFGFGKKKYSYKYVDNAIGRLRKKGLIEFKEKNGKKFIKLTDMGKKQLFEYENGKYKLRKPKKWDKKWRIVIFDIPEKQRVLRNHIRTQIVNFGFIRLQNSVWVCPYECEELIIMLKADNKIGKNVLYITADSIEYDIPLRKAFELK